MKIRFSKPPFGMMEGDVVDEHNGYLRVRVEDPFEGIQEPRYFRLHTSGHRKDDFEVVEE